MKFKESGKSSLESCGEKKLKIEAQNQSHPLSRLYHNLKAKGKGENTMNRIINWS